MSSFRWMVAGWIAWLAMILHPGFFWVGLLCFAMTFVSFAWWALVTAFKGY